jgi:hypothetical protein
LGPAAYLSVIGLADELVMCMRESKQHAAKLVLVLGSFLKNRKDLYQEKRSAVTFVLTPVAPPEEHSFEEWIARNIFSQKPGQPIPGFSAVALGFHPGLARCSDIPVDRHTGIWRFESTDDQSESAARYEDLVNLIDTSHDSRLQDRPLSEFLRVIESPTSDEDLSIATGLFESYHDDKVAVPALGEIMMRDNSGRIAMTMANNRRKTQDAREKGIAVFPGSGKAREAEVSTSAAGAR